MSFSAVPNPLESAFVQRDRTNTYYEQVNISGSDLIFYHSSSGELTADRISVWAKKYNIGINGGGSGLFASQSVYATQSLYATQSISSDTSSFIGFNGNRNITRSGYTGINVGGTDVTTFLNNFFFPFQPATITLNSGTTYYETGSTQNISLNGTITANQETIFSNGAINRDGSLLFVWSPIPPYTDNVTDNGISSSHDYQASVQTGNNGSPTTITSGTKSVRFVFPYLWGTSTNGSLTGTALYNAMTKSIVAPMGSGGATNINFYGTAVYIYFCQPVSASVYRPVSSIKDPNSFEISGTFNVTNTSPQSTGLANNWQFNYTIYRLALPADPNGGTFVITSS